MSFHSPWIRNGHAMFILCLTAYRYLQRYKDPVALNRPAIYTAVHHSIWFEQMELAITKQFICSSLNSLTYVIPFSSPVNQHHQHRPKYSVPISTNFRWINNGVYGVIEEILEEDGKGNTNTIIMGEWNSVVGDEPYRNIAGPHGLGRKNHRGQMLINFCERNGLIVTTHGSGSLREDCTHGRNQKIGVDIS